MTNIKAVIFDLDGIIIDSEPWQKQAFEETLKPYQIKISDEKFASFIGIRTIENFKYLVKKYNLPLTPEKITKIKNKKYDRILKQKMQPRENFMDLLYYLNKKYILSVASGSIKKDVYNTLQLLKIKKYFKAILTGDDVIHGKPHPEIFIKTAGKLNVKNENCVVIEDSENGIIAAKKAQMLAIAIPTPYTDVHNFKKADYVFNNLSEIKNVL